MIQKRQSVPDENPRASLGIRIATKQRFLKHWKIVCSNSMTVFPRRICDHCLVAGYNG